MSSEETERSKSWGLWKNGCIGCAGATVLGLGLLVIAVVRGNVAPEWRREVHSQPLAASATEPIELTLDLQKGEFTVEPIAADESLRIEANYNASLFVLRHPYDEASRRLRISFDSKPLVATIETDGAEEPFVHIFVPRGLPLRLNGKVRVGASRLELGGLTLEDVDLEVSAGEHTISFTEPTSTTGKSIAIEASMGKLTVAGLGNASPAAAKIRQSAGESSIDLSGHWRGDSDIDIGYRAGRCTVQSPGGEVGFVVERSSVLAGSVDNTAEDRPAPAGAPTVRLSSSGTAGGIEIR